MKKLFTFLLLIVCCHSFGQSDTAIAYTEVVNVAHASQQQLFTQAREWVDNSFKNMKAVLSINDKASGELAGKGIMRFEILYMGRKQPVPVTVEFKMNIRTKDGKYKYEFTNFNVLEFWDQRSDIGIIKSENDHQWFGTKKWSEIAYQETKEKVNEQMRELISTLKTDMNKNDDF